MSIDWLADNSYFSIYIPEVYAVIINWIPLDTITVYLLIIWNDRLIVDIFIIIWSCPTTF
jgi:hypothetical protein